MKPIDTIEAQTEDMCDAIELKMRWRLAEWKDQNEMTRKLLLNRSARFLGLNLTARLAVAVCLRMEERSR